MSAYLILSKKLYKENIGLRPTEFICNPKTFLCKKLRSQIFPLINEHKGSRKLSQYIKDLEGRPYDEKYLFILGLVFCIPEEDKDSERNDQSYWNSFKENISNEKTPDEILNLISKFCKRHQIPFFDIYQNRNQKNFCSRIYSLMPFEQGELQALAFIAKKEEIKLQTDFTLFRELALTSYSSLFNRATLRALKGGDEVLESSKSEDVLQITSYNQLFSKYLELYWEDIENTPLFKEVEQKLEEKLKIKVRGIRIQDFHVYLNTKSTLVADQLYLQPRGSLFGEITFDKMPLPIQNVSCGGKLKMNYLGTHKEVSLDWTKKYLVYKSQNSDWFEIGVDYERRLYKEDIFGYTEINDGLLLVIKVDFEQIPKEIKNKYTNIYSSANIEFIRGLAYHNERYMWFAIPDIIVHNHEIHKVKMKLNGQDIPSNNGKSLKEKFYKFLENKKKTLQFPLATPSGGEHNSLSFLDRDGCVLASIKIERQEYKVEKRLIKTIIANCPVEKDDANIPPNVKYNGDDFDYANKGDYLLFWISRFQERGVSYDRFKNAIVSLYFTELAALDGQKSRDLATVTKRIIEQFIGLGFIRVDDSTNELRYIANKARFIISHKGQCLYTGARSYQELKSILDRDAGKYLRIDSLEILFGGLSMPSLIKYNTDEAGIIEMDKNEVVNKYVIDCFEINRKNPRESNIQSYPIYLLDTYELTRNSIAETNYALFSNCDKVEIFELGSLSFKPVAEIHSIKPGALVQVNEYGIYNRYFAGEQQDSDGKKAIALYKILPARINDAIYFLEDGNSIRHLGWMYDEKKCALYIPRRINIPHQIRQALQCCLGTYTKTFFTKSSGKKSAMPAIQGNKLLLTETLGNGLIEIEQFLGITNRFLAALEHKLKIKTIKITTECNHL